MRCLSTCFFATLAIFSLVPLLLLSGEHWLPRPATESQSWATPPPSIETVPQRPRQPPNQPNREGLRSKRNQIVPVFLAPEWKWTFNDIYDATYGFRGFNGQLDSTPCLAATSSAFEARFRLERILGGPSIPAALRNSLVSRPNFPQTMHIKLSHIKIIKNAT